MTRRVPWIATLVVLAAAAAMVALGLWQLQRLRWKEALLTRYQAAETMNADAPWPRSPAEAERVLYRHATLDCIRAEAPGSVAGRSDRGASGIAHTALCRLA